MFDECVKYDEITAATEKRPQTMEGSTNEIRIEIDSLPEETRRYILALAAQHDISPADATRIVLNYAATQSAA